MVAHHVYMVESVRSILGTNLGLYICIIRTIVIITNTTVQTQFIPNRIVLGVCNLIIVNLIACSGGLVEA